MARTQILDTGGGPEQGFRRWFWDGLNQSLVPPPSWVLSVAQARLILVANSLQNIAITEFNYSVCAMIVPNRLKFASFSYFQVNLPKLTWLIFLSHSKYDTVTPPAFKYKSCKIRISLRGAMSRYLLDLFKKTKARRSIHYMRKTISQSIFSHCNCFPHGKGWQGWTWIETWKTFG